MRRAPPITTMAGQVYSTDEHILEKREPRHRVIKSFLNPGVLTCTLPIGGYVKVPPYPGPGAVTRIENKPPGQRNAEENAILATLRRWYVGKQDRLALPSITRVDTHGLRNAGSNGQQIFISQNRYPEVNIDHICMFTSTYYIDFSIILIISLF
jgi:hypothetical protein